jgi:hypothetical protein
MMKSKLKTDWKARFTCKKPLQIKRIEKSFADIPAGASMLIVTPQMVDAAVRKIPFGKSLEQVEIRKILAKKYSAQYACPVTTGIALRVVSEFSFVEHQAGRELAEITPFWRAVNPTSKLAEKLECGIPFLLERRKAEGI